MNGLLRDLLNGWRILARDPGYTLATVLTLALGIGLNTAIFSLANPVLLKPLPVRDPDRLMYLNAVNPSRDQGGMTHHNLAYPDYLDYRAANRAFEDLGIYQYASWTVTHPGDPERVRGSAVSANLFSVLGVLPRFGRGFQMGDDQPGAESVVLLSHDYWQRRFGGDTNVLAEVLNLNGRSHAIVGVMPPGFRFPLNDGDLWVPLVVANPEGQRGAFSCEGIARLKPGVSLEQARADLQRISRNLEVEHPDTNTGVRAVIRPLREELVQEFVAMFWVLLGAVGLVLAVACVNVANLGLARALDRQREWAIRTSLGASRGQLARLLLVETAWLALTGCVLGLLLSKWALGLFLSLLPVAAPYWLDVSLDYRVLLFTFGTIAVSCLIAGLAPAWQASRVAPFESLRAGTPGAGERGRHQNLRSILVAAEVALALVLVGGTAAMVQALWNLQRADAGFNPADVLVFSVAPGNEKHAQPDSRVRFYREMQQRLAALPAVKSAAAVVNLPMRGDYWKQSFYLEDRPEPAPAQMPLGDMRVVTPGYFRTLEIPLLQGRDFDETDQPTSRPVVIVDATFARSHFPNESPIGRRLRMTFRRDTSWEVVGVVGDVRQYGLDRPLGPGLYFPFTQLPVSSMTVVLKSRNAAAGNLLADARQAIHRIDDSVVVATPTLMKEVIARSYWQIPFMGRVFAVFAGLALVLAAVGVAGLVRFAVARRLHEIGVRLALGASKAGVVRLLCGTGFRPALAGMVLGLLGGAALLRAFQGELYGFRVTDLWHHVVVALVLGGVALAASYLPARRVARIDPMAILRFE